MLLAAALCPTLAQRVSHYFKDNGRVPQTRTARCTMRLHMDGTEVGGVEFQSDGTLQRMDIHLESTAISEGDHALHVNKRPVAGYNCNSTQTVYNPTEDDSDSPPSFEGRRYAGDFGNVKADVKGRVNWQSKFVVREGSSNHGTVHIEPLLQLVKRRRILEPVPQEYDAEEEAEDVVDATKRSNYMYYARYLVSSARFALEGEQSLVGRSVVLYAGRGCADGGPGNSGLRIACCTLVPV